MSHNIVPTFVLFISRPPKHLEIPSWTFFHSPFHADFKTIQFVVSCWNLDQDIAKILEGSHFKNQHFLFITESTLKITQEYSGSLKSTHEHLWALMSTDKYCAKALWVVKAPWRQTHEHLWALMGAVGAKYNAHECSWLLMSAHENSWMLMRSPEHAWAWCHGHTWAMMSAHGGF